MRSVIARAAICIIAVGLATVLGGCATVTAGIVTDKDHRAAYTYITQQCTSYHPTTGACQIWMPMTHHFPASWKVQLENSSGDRGWIAVPADTWDHLAVGDYYDRDAG